MKKLALILAMTIVAINHARAEPSGSGPVKIAQPTDEGPATAPKPADPGPAEKLKPVARSRGMTSAKATDPSDPPAACDREVIAAVVRAGKGKPAMNDPAVLEAFLGSPKAEETPDLTASALAALWLASPEQAGKVYSDHATSFRTAQKTIAERRGLVAAPCLSKEQFLPLWPRVKPRWEAALKRNFTEVFAPGPYVTFHARYTCFQMRDCSSVRLVDKRVRAALERPGVRGTPRGPGKAADQSELRTMIGDDCGGDPSCG